MTIGKFAGLVLIKKVLTNTGMLGCAAVPSDYSLYYPALRPKIYELTRDYSTFTKKIDAFVRFREAGCHILLPVDQQAEWAFFTNGDDAEI